MSKANEKVKESAFVSSVFSFNQGITHDRCDEGYYFRHRTGTSVIGSLKVCRLQVGFFRRGESFGPVRGASGLKALSKGLFNRGVSIPWWGDLSSRCSFLSYEV